MRTLQLGIACAAVALTASAASAAQITGEYIEARTCDVYTGPCFANAEMDLAGQEAVMAWKIEKGSWDEVALANLGVAIVVRAEGTLGYDGVFPMKAGKMQTVVLVDEQATTEQRDALVSFVKNAAADYTKSIVKIEQVPFSLENDHLSGKGKFAAGELARIETRGLKQGDCVCTNEAIYYLPLTKVSNFSPAYSLTLSYQGEGLDSTWNSHNLRSAFLATFRK